MPEAPAGTSDKHFKYLDSARGIASLMVFGTHFIARSFQDKMNVHYFFFLFNGNDAVSFFFVLSGFVLSYKYVVLSKQMDVRQFYVSRFFRLFPAYFLVVLWSALYAYRSRLNMHDLTDLFVYDKDGFWEEAALLRFHNKFYYPGWTLTLEMLGSILMPFYIALAIKNKRFVPWLIIATLIIGNNLLFSYLFLFGIIASTNYSEIVSDSFRETKWYRYRYLLLIGAIILFSLRQVNEISRFGPSYFDFAGFLGIDFFTYTGPACFVFLVAILHSKKVQRFLENRVLVFLGGISYSIYLVHVVIIDMVYSFRGRFFPGPDTPLSIVIVTVSCIAAVVTVSAIMHYCVELPFMRIGKRIAGRLKPSLVIGRGID